MDDGHRDQYKSRHQIERRTAQPDHCTGCIRGFELIELGEKDEDGQAIDETEHYGVRNQPDQFTKLQKAHCHLNQTQDRKSKRLNSSHVDISYAVFWLKNI